MTHVADLVRELEDIAKALDARGVEFALCGGLAVAIHGHVRATRDIDLLLPSAARERALTTLAEVGSVLPAAPMTFGAGTLGGATSSARARRWRASS